MKTLKFTNELFELILKGEKTTTWRLFDDKDLQVGDELKFQNKETGEEFGKGVIVACKTKKLKDVDDADYDGHEPFSSFDEMISTYKKYYGESVHGETEVKIIKFSFSK